MRWLAFQRVAAFLVVAPLMACDQSVSGPEMPVTSRAAAWVSATAGSFPGWSSSRESDLQGLLESERARTSIEQAQSKVAYDSLKAVWEAFRKNGSNGRASPLLMCEPLKYAADTKIIGPAGGDIKIGPHELRIPPGALSEYTVITGEQPVSTNAGVMLSPHGLYFLEEPTLVLSYNHCFRPSDRPYRIAYVGEDGQILEWTSSYDVKRTGELFGWIWHFSMYEVAIPGYVAAGG